VYVRTEDKPFLEYRAYPQPGSVYKKFIIFWNKSFLPMPLYYGGEKENHCPDSG
jgi:hypothetical protein